MKAPSTKGEYYTIIKRGSLEFEAALEQAEQTAKDWNADREDDEPETTVTISPYGSVLIGDGEMVRCRKCGQIALLMAGNVADEHCIWCGYAGKYAAEEAKRKAAVDPDAVVEDF